MESQMRANNQSKSTRSASLLALLICCICAAALTTSTAAAQSFEDPSPVVENPTQPVADPAGDPACSNSDTCSASTSFDCSYPAMPGAVASITNTSEDEMTYWARISTIAPQPQFYEEEHLEQNHFKMVVGAGETAEFGGPARGEWLVVLDGAANLLHAERLRVDCALVSVVVQGIECGETSLIQLEFTNTRNLNDAQFDVASDDGIATIALTPGERWVAVYASTTDPVAVTQGVNNIEVFNSTSAVATACEEPERPPLQNAAFVELDCTRGILQIAVVNHNTETMQTGIRVGREQAVVSVAGGEHAIREFDANNGDVRVLVVDLSEGTYLIRGMLVDTTCV